MYTSQAHAFTPSDVPSDASDNATEPYLKQNFSSVMNKIILFLSMHLTILSACCLAYQSSTLSSASIGWLIVHIVIDQLIGWTRIVIMCSTSPKIKKVKKIIFGISVMCFIFLGIYALIMLVRTFKTSAFLDMIWIHYIVLSTVKLNGDYRSLYLSL